MNKLESRIEKIRKEFAQNQIDGLLVFIQENRFYLSGFDAEDSQFDETAGILAIGKEKLILATDSRFTVRLKLKHLYMKFTAIKEDLVKKSTILWKQLELKKPDLNL